MLSIDPIQDVIDQVHRIDIIREWLEANRYDLPAVIAEIIETGIDVETESLSDLIQYAANRSY